MGVVHGEKQQLSSYMAVQQIGDHSKPEKES